MYALDTAVKDQTDRAAVRINEGVDERQKKIALLRQKGGIARADEPSRIASRIDRLSRFHPDIRPVDPAAIIAEDPKAMGDAGAILERIINTNELLGARYLEGGVVASRSIGRAFAAKWRRTSWQVPRKLCRRSMRSENKSCGRAMLACFR